VGKIAQTKAELGELIVNEMRKQPGCERLVAVRVVSNAGGWFIAPHDPAAHFSEAAQRAAIAVQISLHKRYVVASD
jgi:uncharacterized membrane protein